MRVILFILQKEFLQIFRNRALLPIIFALPIVQLIVLSNAATFEVKEVRIAVLDEDHAEASMRLVRKMEASGLFVVSGRPDTVVELEETLLDGSASVALHFPRHFERDLQSDGTAPLQLVFDAQDGATAGVAQAYASSIIAAYNRELLAETFSGTADPGIPVVVTPVNWFNPRQKYTAFMVPGILVLLVTIITMFISAMNIVREKEIGTIEQLNVTPISKAQFIIGKLLPLWIIGLFELAFGLVVARFVFNVPMVGSIVLLFEMAAVYLVVMLGFGLWLSTMTNTQQQAMFLAWFFMVVFILMSGLFTPIESMPPWAQHLSLLNPVAHFMKITRRLLLMGADIRAIRAELLWLLSYAVVVLTLAVRQHRKVSS